MMTPLDTQAIRARAEAATKGPWSNVGDIYVYAPIGMVADTPINEDAEWITRARGVGRGATIEEQHRNIAFIAAARQDVPALCDEVDALREKLAAEKAENHEWLAAARQLNEATTDEQQSAALACLDALRLGNGDVHLPSEIRLGLVARLAAAQHNFGVAAADAYAEHCENADLSARVASLEAAIREHGKCTRCNGYGIVYPYCPRCSDSTDDHYCPTRETCGACGATGAAPWVRAALSGDTSALDAALAETRRAERERIAEYFAEHGKAADERMLPNAATHFSGIAAVIRALADAPEGATTNVRDVRGLPEGAYVFDGADRYLGRVEHQRLVPGPDPRQSAPEGAR